MAGLDALGEMIGRAAETGKPVHFTTGWGTMTGTEAPQQVAGLAVLGYVTRLAARYNVPVIYTVALPETIPIATEIMREAYVAEGKLDVFKPEESIRFTSTDSFAYTSAVQGIAERERPAVNIMIGPFYAHSMTFAETFFRIGAIQLAGTARGYQIPFFAVVCDYLLIGEEIFAAGAYLSKAPTQVGSIWGQDMGKIIALALLTVGVLLTLFGNRSLIALLRT
jgi:hypothetical protein